MSELTLEERVTRLEELFKLQWGELDIETQKKWVREAHERLGKLNESIDTHERRIQK